MVNIVIYISFVRWWCWHEYGISPIQMYPYLKLVWIFCRISTAWYSVAQLNTFGIVLFCFFTGKSCGWYPVCATFFAITSVEVPRELNWCSECVCVDHWLVRENCHLHRHPSHWSPIATAIFKIYPIPILKPTKPCPGQLTKCKYSSVLVADERISKRKDVFHCCCICIALKLMSWQFHPALLWQSAKNPTYTEGVPAKVEKKECPEVHNLELVVL